MLYLFEEIFIRTGQTCYELVQYQLAKPQIALEIFTTRLHIFSICLKIHIPLPSFIFSFNSKKHCLPWLS